MFVLIWMHFSWWFQIWSWNFKIFEHFVRFLTSSALACRVESNAWKSIVGASGLASLIVDKNKTLDRWLGASMPDNETRYYNTSWGGGKVVCELKESVYCDYFYHQGSGWSGVDLPENETRTCETAFICLKIVQECVHCDWNKPWFFFFRNGCSSCLNIFMHTYSYAFAALVYRWWQAFMCNHISVLKVCHFRVKGMMPFALFLLQFLLF